MKSFTIDILDEKVIPLLKNIEDLHLIHIHSDDAFNSSDFISRFKGAIKKQSIDEVEKKLRELRR